MRKALALFFLLFIGLPVLSFAQDDDAPDVEPDWDVITSDAYVKGDQTFNISLGIVFPVLFLNEGKIINHNFSPPVGGAGALSYNYFLSSNLFVGGEINGMFIPTLGNSSAFIILFGGRFGYQFILWRFEFPINFSVGMSLHRYLNYGHYSMYLKGGGSVYYRFNSDWSFGLNFSWLWLPEWTRDEDKNRTPKKDVYGNIIDLTLSARYHF